MPFRKNKTGKQDKQDWKDDILFGLEISIIVVLTIMFYSYISQNETISQVLLPTNFTLLVIAAIPFVALFLFIRWLNREKV